MLDLSALHGEAGRGAHRCVCRKRPRRWCAMHAPVLALLPPVVMDLPRPPVKRPMRRR